MYQHTVKLSEFASTADVLECVVNALQQRTDDEFIYDDEQDTLITFDDARKVIAQLRLADQ